MLVLMDSTAHSAITPAHMKISPGSFCGTTWSMMRARMEGITRSIIEAKSLTTSVQLITQR